MYKIMWFGVKVVKAGGWEHWELASLIIHEGVSAGGEGVTLSLLFLWKPKSEVNHGLWEGTEQAKITQNRLPKIMGEKLEDTPKRQVLGGQGVSVGFADKHKFCGSSPSWKTRWELPCVVGMLEKLSLYLTARAAPCPEPEQSGTSGDICFPLLWLWC